MIRIQLVPPLSQKVAKNSQNLSMFVLKSWLFHYFFSFFSDGFFGEKWAFSTSFSSSVLNFWLFQSAVLVFLFWPFYLNAKDKDDNTLQFLPFCLFICHLPA